jgi:UDP-N-acetylglucosamine--N-acetylmuramyl-(pentapeptide) pyrophosphoryl-undecaprenol N-acetylglucosamine transferase
MEAFIEDMASAYRWADLVLCRAGALTISELAIMGRPAILVPLPQAIDDHQTVNARTLVREGAAVKVLQTEFDAYLLSALLKEYKSRPDRLKAMSDAAYRCARPDATAAVCDHCEELIHGD